MNSRAFISVFVTASILLFPGDAFAKTASCPCSPCKCSPCTCGSGGGKHGKHHEGERERAGVGVGVNVDLGGVGQRKTEADPFATTSHQPAAQTEEKPKTKRS